MDSNRQSCNKGISGIIIKCISLFKNLCTLFCHSRKLKHWLKEDDLDTGISSLRSFTYSLRCFCCITDIQTV